MAKPSTKLTTAEALALDSFAESLQRILKMTKEALQNEQPPEEKERLYELKERLRARIASAIYERDQMIDRGEDLLRREKVSLVRNETSV